MIGKQIGNYRVTRTLGQGGMGTVFAAVDELLEREVAIKVLRPDVASQPEVVERFRREAIILGKLNHPNIATIYGLHRQDDELYMVLELVAGRTLDALLRDIGRLPADRIVDICGQVLAALQTAHAAGVVHRDLKPSNLMLTENGLVKVMDFGIARVMGSTRHTQTGFVSGTLAYMAPEQLRGIEGDARVDIYALGVVAYQLLTGYLPFDDSHAIGLMRAKLEEMPPPASQRLPDIPEWLDRALQTALATDPEQRHPDTESFRVALGLPARATHSAGVPLGSHGAAGSNLAPPSSGTAPVPRAVERPRGPDDTGPLATVPIAPPAPGSATHALPAPGARRTSWLPLVAALLLAIAVAAAAVWMRRDRTREVARSEAGAMRGDQERSLSSPAVQAPVAPLPAPESPAASASAGSATRSRERSAVRQDPGNTAAALDTATAPSAASNEAPPPATVNPAPEPSKLPPAVFRNVRLMVVEDDEPDEHDAVLTLDGSGLSIMDRDVDEEEQPRKKVKTIRYADITAATYSQSKHPRWKEGAITAAAVGVFAAPVFFMKSTRHWLTVQTPSELTVLRLDKSNFETIVSALEARLGHKVGREIESKKQ